MRTSCYILLPENVQNQTPKPILKPVLLLSCQWKTLPFYLDRTILTSVYDYCLFFCHLLDYLLAGGYRLLSGFHEACLLHAEVQLPQPLLQGSAATPWLSGALVLNLFQTTHVFLYWGRVRCGHKAGCNTPGVVWQVLSKGESFPSEDCFPPKCITMPLLVLNLIKFLSATSYNLPRSFWITAFISSTAAAHLFPEFGNTCKQHGQGLVNFQVLHNIKKDISCDRQLRHSTSYEPLGEFKSTSHL